MKWGDWQSKRDVPWEAIVGIGIIAMLAMAMIYMAGYMGEMGGWLEKVLEALS